MTASVFQSKTYENMKTKTQRKQTSHRLPTILALMVVTTMVVVSSAFAASQTWSNAPVSGSWATAANWMANAVPGGLNLTGNSGINYDVATFNSPIPPSGYGGASSPILTDPATATNYVRCRQIGSMVFDTTACGPYVISCNDPINITDGNLPFSGVLYLAHNGSIRINEAVTNDQKVLVPLQVRLPSSTQGYYNLVNNSTNNATLFIASITNNSANTRGTFFVLNGTNTGTNTVAAMSRGTSTSGGTCGITKQGAGTWILSGPNDFQAAAGMNILAGTLIVKDAAAFGLATTANITNTGVLQIDGVTLGVTSLTLKNGGNIRMNGSATVASVIMQAASGNSATLSTLNTSDVMTVGAVTAGLADSTLNTAGPGTILFNTDSSYLGKVSLGAKTNQISAYSALGAGANVNVGAGAVFDITPFGPITYTPSTAGFGGSGTGIAVGTTAAAVLADASASIDLYNKNVNLTLTPTTFSGDLTHPALYIARGTLSLNGNTFFVNNASGTALGVGTYRLIQQASGSIATSGGYAVLVSGSGLAPGVNASIEVVGANVNLVVTAYVPKNLVWQGEPSGIWDIASTANWLNGASLVAFNNSDNVTFNAVGATYSTVSLSGTVAPTKVTVDASGVDYTLVGGSIAGTTALNKIGTGVLNLQMPNTYAGGTVVSNGVLRVGTENAISKTGAGDVAVYGSGILDLGGLNNTINGLLGNGHVDVQNGGTSILTVGNNDRDGLFSGTISNTYGSLALTKTGNGAQTLSGANTYGGGTTVEAGTLVVASGTALGTGALTINGGEVDLHNSVTLSSLAGSAGSLVNNTTGSTNMVVVQTTAANIYYGGVNNGTNGQLAVTVLGAGSLRLNSANSYSGGTFVGAGSTFYIGNGSGAYVTGPVFASNNATLGLPGGSAPPGTPTSITTVDGAMVLFTSGAEGNIWGGQFIGSATATNRFIAPVSSGANLSFSNFLGVVQFANTNSNNNFRFFNGGGVSGGDNALFEFIAGNVHTRDAQTIRLGAITGGSSSCGIGGAATAAAQDTFIIGAKNLSTVFAGYFNGSNNLVKVGTGRLDMTGLSVTTNTDGVTYTNLTYAPIVTHVGYTTISNGVLALLTPNNFSNSLSINLAGDAAVLDASKMGFVTNFTNLYGEYSDLVTNDVLDVLPAQTLSGIGSIFGHVAAASGSILSVGLPTGTLSVSNGIALTDTTVRMNLNRTNASTCSKLAATGSGAIVVNGGTLTVTNLGSDLVTGDVFPLFNKAITGTGFTGITLPVSNALNTIQYVYENNLAVNGSVKVLVGVNPVDPNPTNITYTVSGNQLTLAWPASHIGWTLQAQTNSLNVGISNNWVDVPGTSTINSTNITINPANGTVFYRMKL